MQVWKNVIQGETILLSLDVTSLDIEQEPSLYIWVSTSNPSEQKAQGLYLKKI